MPHDDGVESTNFAQYGAWAVTASSDKTARVWDTATGAPVGKPLRLSDQKRREIRTDGPQFRKRTNYLFRADRPHRIFAKRLRLSARKS